jgi:hypothetical protein
LLRFARNSCPRIEYIQADYERSQNNPENDYFDGKARFTGTIAPFRFKLGHLAAQQKGEGVHVLILPNVELIRVKDGATPAPPEACLTPTSDPSIGSVCPIS